jgi:hypothetical protein
MAAATADTATAAASGAVPSAGMAADGEMGGGGGE